MSFQRHVMRRFTAGLMSAALVFAGTAPGAWAHDVQDDLGKGVRSLGHKATGFETKRIKGTGEGMPSVRGPFPDTVNMTFLGQVTNGDMGLKKLVFTGATFLSDIWGWTDPESGNEYAIVGTSSGVVLVRVTDPTNPEFLGIVPTTNPGTIRNFWWDMKTFGDYAYWTTEVNNAGVGIFNLQRLDDLAAVPPGTPLAADARWGVDPATGIGPDPETGYVRAHNIVINPDKALAYLIGVSKAAGFGFSDDGIVILDISDPLNPSEVATIDGEDIDSHDAQVVTYTGPDPDHQGKEILVNFNGGALDVQVWDVTDLNNITQISDFEYRGAGFSHQGWFTEDQAFILVSDEEDELFGISDPRNPDLPDTARTHICDARDLDNVDCYGVFDSEAASIDHNLFVKGDKVYQAHYTAGVRVLEISDDGTGSGRIALAEVGHMDTEPRLPNKHMNHNLNIFVGPWGVFPFFDSGTIAASDGLNGLVLMKLND